MEGERIADGIGRTVVKNLRVMARMGVYFEEEVQRRYPEFPTRKGEWNWDDYLPPISPSLRQLVASYSRSLPDLSKPLCPLSGRYFRN